MNPTFPQTHVWEPALTSTLELIFHSFTVSFKKQKQSKITETLHILFCLFVCLFYFWLHCIFIAASGLFLVAASKGYSLLRCVGLSLRWLLLLWSTGSRRMGFSSCGMRAQQLWLVGSRAQAQQLWCTGLVALWHVGSSTTRDRTCVPCIGRWILNHCATREVPRNPPYSV